MGKIRNCVVTRYDETITKPPYETIEIDSFKVYKPNDDYLGEKFAALLYKNCLNKGYRFKCYCTTQKDGFDYEVVVY